MALTADTPPQVVAPIPTPTPQAAPVQGPPPVGTQAPAAMSAAVFGSGDMSDPKNWYQPGDSANMKAALAAYVAARNTGRGLHSALDYITLAYGKAIANTIRNRAGLLTAQAAAGGDKVSADPSQNMTAALGDPNALTTADIMNAGLAPDVTTAQQILDAAAKNPQQMASIRLTVTQAQQQQFLSMAGLSPTMATTRVQLQLGPRTPLEASKSLLSQSDVSTTFADALTRPQSWATDQIQAMQDQLVAAGLLTAGQYHPGIYDPQTIHAYGGALQTSLQMNQPLSSALSTLASSQPTPAATPEVRADPGVVNNYIMTTHQKLTGRVPTADEMAQLTADYRNFEDKAYQSNIEAAKSGFGAQRQVYSYNPQSDIAAEIAQSQPAQLYGFEPYASAISHILGM